MSSLRLSVLAVMLASVAGVAAVSAQQLPNGASSINETYGDWSVNCRIIEGQKQCLLGHAQGNGQTGQRVFVIDLRAPKDGKTEGTIVMPFGLKLDSGAVLKLDDRDLGQGLRFSTCVPQGCLMPVSFPAAATDAMKKGKTLTVASLNMSNSEVVSFNIPLEGFAAAIARIADLAK
jgi:invasion protein IalB